MDLRQFRAAYGRVILMDEVDVCHGVDAPALERIYGQMGESERAALTRESAETIIRDYFATRGPEKTPKVTRRKRGAA